MRRAAPGPGRGRARALVLLAAVCFGTTGTAAALGPDSASPVAVGAARVVLGGLLLAVVGLWAHRRAGSRAGARTRSGGTAVLVGAAGAAAYQPAFFAGVASSGVAVGTLVALGSAPVVTGALEWSMTGRSPGRRWVVATAGAGAGVAVLSLARAGDAARLDPWGVAASVAAGASYAVYTLAGKRLLDDGWTADEAMGATFGGAAALTALGGAAAFLLVPSWSALDLAWLVSRSGAATASFLALVPTALAYLLFARGLRRLPASEVSTLTLAEPLTAGLLGLLVLREPAGSSFAAGALLLVGGLAVLSVPRRAASARPAGAPVQDEPDDLPAGR